MKIILYWVLAVLLTFGAIVYQRKTGPTYDKKIKLVIENVEYNFKLIRSHGGDKDCKVEIEVPNQNISGIIEYKKFPSKDNWTQVPMERQNNNLNGYLPHLPPAGKYEYKITLVKNGQEFPINEGQSVIIRFKGAVPRSILIPHIFFMFFAMFMGNLAGIMAIFEYRKFKFFTNMTVIFLFVGGLILGPWVQLYAFGEAWAGVPFAWDLTDNKTLIAFIFWIIALFANRKKERPVYTIIASIVMLMIYSIPHSMYGSQLDPETGEIIQGWIRLFLAA
ncbi:MAG: hypothetical protein HQ521_06565 [Bacteroidetes bacterium]|nr:hypothetical protein [Bacteroidota bacterium]